MLRPVHFRTRQTFLLTRPCRIGHPAVNLSCAPLSPRLPDRALRILLQIRPFGLPVEFGPTIAWAGPRNDINFRAMPTATAGFPMVAEPKHVLLADDEAQIRFSVSLILRRAGFRVTAVEDGQKALELTRESVERSTPFDLLVIDIQMPGLTGLELIDEIEKLDALFPILVISGYRGWEAVGRLETRNLLAFAEKPFDPEELLGQVTHVLERFESFRAAVHARPPLRL